MTDNFQARMFKCNACGHRFPRFYGKDAKTIDVTCPKCQRSARINVARLIAIPADLRAAVAQAGTANGIIQHKEV